MIIRVIKSDVLKGSKKILSFDYTKTNIMKDFLFYLSIVILIIRFLKDYGEDDFIPKFKKSIVKIKKQVIVLPEYIRTNYSFISIFFEHRYFKNGFIGLNAILLILNILLCSYKFIKIMALTNNIYMASIGVIVYGAISVNLFYRSVKLMEI